jgi:glycosyltransferase involved in cell wall biosynthesis
MSDLSRVAVIIPALDEEDALPGVLAALPPACRVIVVDNGSSDDTAARAKMGGAHVLYEPRRGYGSAVKRGIAHLELDPPDIVVVLDADHSDRPELLPKLVQPIFDDVADMVLSDRSRTAAPGALTPVQRFGNRFATLLIHAVSGHHFADMGPFRAIRWSSLVTMQMQDPTWGWNVEMQLKAVRHDLRVVEMPVPYGRRRAGVSKISGTLKGSVRAGVRIVAAVYRYR